MFSVYLIRAADCTPLLYDNIFKIFADIKGVISFKQADFTAKLPNYFHWDEAWQHCNTFRQQKNINTTDFVVLLTPQPNDLNWFGTIQPDLQARNMFIHTDGWASFTNAHPEYPIVFEIACYILHFLMKIDVLALNKGTDYPYIHAEPRGCINDICYEKSDVTLNLRTADICHDCCQKILDEKIPQTVLQQIFKILETVRRPMLSRALFNETLTPSRLIIKQDLSIILPDFEDRGLKMTPLETTFYIFMLMQAQPLTVAAMKENNKYYNQMNSLYQIMPGARNLETTITNFFSSLDPSKNKNTLNETVSKINSGIKKSLPEFSLELVQNYLLDSDKIGKRYISLPKEKIVIENQDIKTIFLK